MTNKESYQKLLKTHHLRVTPQRMTVLEAFSHLKKHPRAEDISEHIRKEHPGISTATIYNILDSFVSAGILSLVKTDKGAMLYDSITEQHHHLYSKDSNLVEDYHDKDLDDYLKEYFKKRKIAGFEINEIKLQIVGEFTNNKNK